MVAQKEEKQLKSKPVFLSMSFRRKAKWMEAKKDILENSEILWKQQKEFNKGYCYPVFWSSWEKWQFYERLRFETLEHG